jgi:hypothetical protein
VPSSSSAAPGNDDENDDDDDDDDDDDNDVFGAGAGVGTGFTRKFVGHRNSDTVKQVAFFGPHSEVRPSTCSASASARPCLVLPPP